MQQSGSMGKEQQCGAMKVEGADSADDAAAPSRRHPHAACKREGADVACGRSSGKRHCTDLVSLGLDSPPCGSGPGVFAAARPYSAAAAPCALRAAQAVRHCRPEAGPAAVHASGAVKSEQQQQQQDLGLQRVSQDSWDSGGASPAAAAATADAQPVGAEAALHATARPSSRPSCRDTSPMPRQCIPEPLPQQQHPQQHQAEPSKGDAGTLHAQGGDAIDLTGVDVAEQERILRQIEGSQKRAQLLRKGCASGKAAKGQKISIRDFFLKKA